MHGGTRAWALVLHGRRDADTSWIPQGECGRADSSGQIGVSTAEEGTVLGRRENTGVPSHFCSRLMGPLLFSDVLAGLWRACSVWAPFFHQPLPPSSLPLLTAPVSLYLPSALPLLLLFPHQEWFSPTHHLLFVNADLCFTSLVTPPPSLHWSVGSSLPYSFRSSCYVPWPGRSWRLWQIGEPWPLSSWSPSSPCRWIVSLLRGESMPHSSFLTRACSVAPKKRHRVLRQTDLDSSLVLCRVNFGDLMNFSVLHCLVSAMRITIPISLSLSLSFF